MSESALSVTLIAQEGSIEGGIGGNNNPLPLGPYASMRFATDHTNGLRVVVVITGPATAGSRRFPANFTGGQHLLWGLYQDKD